MVPARRSPAPPVAGLLAAAFALALAGCPSREQASGLDQDAATPPPPARDAGLPASAAVPPPLELEVRYQMRDAGLARIDFPGTAGGGARPAIEPTSRLEVSTNIGLQNYRVRLFDEVDRAMVSDDQMEEPGDKVLYRIQLPAPLRAGHKYAVVVDAQAGSAIADSTGRLYPDQRMEFTVAGAREPDPPAPKPGKVRPGAVRKLRSAGPGKSKPGSTKTSGTRTRRR